MTRVAAVDCGTNSIRLLIADRTGDALTEVVRESEVVRLGYGVDRTGRIDPAAMARTLAATSRYATLCDSHDVAAVRFVATSASRDASNATEFVEGVRSAFGERAVSPEVISGDEEAALSFRGATGQLLAAGVPNPYLVVDLGGGSTELVRGSTTVEGGRSLDIGSVRLTERYLVSDPPTPAEVSAAVADVQAALARAEDVVDLSGIRTVVGLAGSITTVTAHALGLPAYDREAINLATLAPEQVTAACASLLSMTRAQRAALPYLHPGRVDVIGAGALIWREVVERVVERSGVARVVTSEHDILDGIALSVSAAD